MRVVRHLVELLDEDRALALELLDHGAVVHDLVADIDRRAVAPSASSTMRMARSTPAQKPRGPASRIWSAGRMLMASGSTGAVTAFLSIGRRALWVSAPRLQVRQGDRSAAGRPESSMPLSPSRRPARRSPLLRLFALAGPLALAACGGGTDSASRFPPPCPAIRILPQGGDLRLWNGRGRDVTDQVLDGRVTGMDGGCSPGGAAATNVKMSVHFDLQPRARRAGTRRRRAVVRRGRARTTRSWTGRPIICGWSSRPTPTGSNSRATPSR